MVSSEGALKLVAHVLTRFSLEKRVLDLSLLLVGSIGKSTVVRFNAPHS